MRKSFGLQSIRAQNTGADAPKWLIFGGKATELRFQLCSTGSPVSLTLSIPTLVLSWVVFKQMFAAEFSSTALPSTIEWIQWATVLICLCSTYLKHLCCQIYGLHMYTYVYMVQLSASDDNMQLPGWCGSTWTLTASYRKLVRIVCIQCFLLFPIIFHRSRTYFHLFSVFQIVGSNPVLSAQENTLVQAETHLEVDRPGSQIFARLDMIPADHTQHALGLLCSRLAHVFPCCFYWSWVLSLTLFETCHKLEPLYVEWLCNCVSNQEGREDCTTNCKHSQQTLARHGLRLEQWLVTRGQPVEYRSVISLITRLRVVVCKQPTSISIMGLDTLNMLILILTGVQEFSKQNAGNASPDFWWKGTDHQKKLREVCRRY